MWSHKDETLTYLCMWSHKHGELTYLCYAVTQARKVNLFMYVVSL